MKHKVKAEDWSDLCLEIARIIQPSYEKQGGQPVIDGVRIEVVAKKLISFRAKPIFLAAQLRCKYPGSGMRRASIKDGEIDVDELKRKHAELVEIKLKADEAYKMDWEKRDQLRAERNKLADEVEEAVTLGTPFGLERDGTKWSLTFRGLSSEEVLVLAQKLKEMRVQA